MRKTKVTHGRVTIPAELRKKYGIKPGMKIVFIDEGSGLRIQPVNRKYIRSLIGITGTKGRALKSLMRDKKREKEL